MTFGITMSYDLKAIEQVCLRHRFSLRRCSDCEVEVDFASQGALTFANTDQGTDTYLGFRDCPWHSHGTLMLMTGDATFVEYAPEDLIEALVSGEVLVVSQYIGGQVRDRWLSHRDERLDLRYVETGEELRVCRIAEPGAAPNSRPPSQLATSPEAQTPDSLRTPPSGGCG
jgi:hypothetical protein